MSSLFYPCIHERTSNASLTGGTCAICWSEVNDVSLVLHCSVISRSRDLFIFWRAAASSGSTYEAAVTAVTILIGSSLLTVLALVS